MKALARTNFSEPVATIEDLGSIVLSVEKLPDPADVKNGDITVLTASQPGYACNEFYVMVNGKWKILPGDVVYGGKFDDTYALMKTTPGQLQNQVDFVVNMFAAEGKWKNTVKLSVRYHPGSAPTNPQDGSELCSIDGSMIDSRGMCKLSGFIPAASAEEYKYAIFGLMPNGSWYKITDIRDVDATAPDPVTTSLDLEIGYVSYAEMWMDFNGAHLSSNANYVGQFKLPKLTDLDPTDAPELSDFIARSIISGESFVRTSVSVGGLNVINSTSYDTEDSLATRTSTFVTGYVANDGEFVFRTYNKEPNTVVSSSRLNSSSYPPTVSVSYRVDGVVMTVIYRLSISSASFDVWDWISSILNRGWGLLGLLGQENVYQSQEISYPNTMMLRGLYQKPDVLEPHSIWLQVLNARSIRCLAVLGTSTLEDPAVMLSKECPGTSLQVYARNPYAALLRDYCAAWDYPAPAYKGSDPVLQFNIGD